MASGWDRGSIAAANYLGNPNGPGTDEAIALLQRKCSAFFENFRIESQFIYRYAPHRLSPVCPSLQ